MFTKLKTHFNSLPAVLTAVIVGLFVGVLVVHAAWSNPTANPPAGNANPPLDSSATAQAKAGDLTLNNNLSVGKNLTVSAVTSLIQSVTGGNLALNAAGTYANALLIPSGKVGIGTLAPTATLQVKGTTRILGVPVINLNFNTTYTATSDGFVMAYMNADDSGDRCTLNGVSGTNDSSGTPRFAQAQASAAYDTEGTPNVYVHYANIFLPVWKGYVWYVSFGSEAGTCQAFLRFIPLGQTNNA